MFTKKKPTEFTNYFINADDVYSLYHSFIEEVTNIALLSSETSKHDAVKQLIKDSNYRFYQAYMEKQKTLSQLKEYTTF